MRLRTQDGAFHVIKINICYDLIGPPLPGHAIRSHRMSASPCTSACPVQTVVDLIQGKWTPQILRALLPGMCRFTCLRRQLPGISAKVLSQRLRELEAQGLLLRTVLPCVPPAVEYRLSASGAELANLLGSLYHFGVRHLNQHTRYAA